MDDMDGCLVNKTMILKVYSTENNRQGLNLKPFIQLFLLANEMLQVW